MLHGALVYIDKDKNGNRLIQEAIHKGLRLYERHYKNVPAQELVALVDTKIFLDQKLQSKTFSMDVDWHDSVPTGHLWICKKGLYDDSNR